jgi:hypothetical protein
MVNVNQLREIVSRYLSSGDADRFVLDFSAASYGIRDSGDADAIALVDSIESKISDLHCACISKSDLRDFLGALVNPYLSVNLSVTVVPFQIAAMAPINSSAAVAGMGIQAWAESFGISPVAESESERRLVPEQH